MRGIFGIGKETNVAFASLAKSRNRGNLNIPVAFEPEKIIEEEVGGRMRKMMSWLKE